jgi:hypothetical protein
MLRTALAIMAAGLVVVGLGWPNNEPAMAAINDQINFQGRLLTAAGAVVADGNYNVEYTIVSGGTGCVAGGSYPCSGTNIWTEDWTNTGGHPVVVKNGYFSVQLGSVTALPSNATLDVNGLWLSMNVAAGANATATCGTFAVCGGDGAMLPMDNMSAAPYAINAADADALGGVAASSFIQNVATNLTQQQASINLLNPAANAALAGSEIQQTASATAPVLVLKGGATPGTGADLLQLQSSGVTVLDRFDSSGNLYIASADGIDTQTTSGTLTVGGTSSTTNATTIDIGNVGSATAQTINIGPNSAADTLNLGAVTGTPDEATSIHIDDKTGSAATKTVSIGSTDGASATTIRGGTGNINLITNSANAGTILQSATNSATALQLQGANGSTLFNADTTTTNLITNSSFVIGTTGWAQTGTGASISQNTAASNSYDGSDSLAVTTSTTANSSGTPTGAQVTGFTGSITPAQYSFAFVAKANASGFADLNVIITGGSAPTCTLSSIIVSTTSWGRYNCTFTTTSTNATAITIGESGTTSHTLWIDDVSLTQASSSSIYGSKASLDGTLVVGAGPEAATTANGLGVGLLAVGSGSGALNDIPLEVQTQGGATLVDVSGTTLSTQVIGGSTFWGTAAFDATASSSTAGTQVVNVQNAFGGSILTAVVQSSNLVTTPTWVIATGSAATNWATKNAGVTLTADSTNAFVGQASAKAVVTTTALAGMQTSVFNAAITTGTQYQLTFWAKCSAAVATLTYGRQDVSGTDVNSTTTGSCTTNWQQYTAHWTTGGTITSPNIYVEAGTTSTTVWIDGVQLVQTTTVAATTYEPGDLYVEGVVKGPVLLENSGNSTQALQVQNSAGGTMLGVDTTQGGQGVVANTNISNTVSWVASWNNSAISATTLTDAPHTNGNLVAVGIGTADVGYAVQSVSGGGVTNWHQVTTHTDNTNNIYQEIWEGTVTSTGSQTVTVNFVSGAPPAEVEIVAQEFTAGLGANTNWAVTSSNSRTNAASATVTFPAITSNLTGEMYWGYSYIGATYTTCVTAGFTCYGTTLGNVSIYNTSLTGGTTYTPTATQNASNYSDTMGMAIEASVGTALTVQGSTNISMDSAGALNVQNNSGTSVLNVNTLAQHLTVQSQGIPLTLNEISTGGEDGIIFSTLGTVKGEIGVANAPGEIINETGTWDLAVKSLGSLWFSAGGSAETEEINTSGDLLIGQPFLGHTTPELLELDNATGGSGSYPSATDGAMFYDANLQSFQCGVDGAWVACNGLVEATTASSSAITATSLTPFSQVYAVPGSGCEAGVVYQITAAGSVNVNASTTDYINQFEIVENGVTIALNDPLSGQGLVITNPSASGQSGPWFWEFSGTITCRSASSVVAWGLFTQNYNQDTPPHSITLSDSAGAPAAWTNGANLNLSMDWQTASLGETITMTSFNVQRIGPP